MKRKTKTELPVAALVFVVVVAMAAIVAFARGDSLDLRGRIEELLIFVHGNVDRPTVLLAFILSHTTAVTLFFPGAILFELFAGFAFGFWRGVLCVALAKLLGALMGFSLGRSVFHAWGRHLVDSSPRWRALFRNVGDDGFRFALLLRLSPLPSYVNTYGLAVTTISYRHFVAATICGSLPFIINNVFMGTMARSLESILFGDILNSQSANNDHEQTDFQRWLRLAFVLLGMISMLVITWRLMRLISLSAEDALLETEQKRRLSVSPARRSSLTRRDTPRPRRPQSPARQSRGRSRSPSTRLRAVPHK